ncbi:MAG: hypothetical protein ABI724_11315 [Betaproteobacteria bacterium]
MGRGLVGVVAGLIAWVGFATVANLALRTLMPGYAETEPAMEFTIAMMIGRLLVGAASSVVAGSVAAWIARGRGWVPAMVGVFLIAMFIPVHVGLWDRFPVWYHLAFLISLLPLALLGAKLVASRRGIAAARQR